MANNIDPRRANVALGLAVARWKKLPNDSIEASLDNPSEWLQESALMNHFLPARLAKAGFSFIAVIPNEFSVGIKTVRQYAGLIYKHMIPVEVVAEIARAGLADITEDNAFHDSARFENISRDQLRSLSAKFVTASSEFLAEVE
jgi:hypothetical protein